MQAGTFSRRWSGMIVVAAMALSFAIGAAQNKDDLNAVISAMNSKAAAFKNVQADFEWETYNAAIKEKDPDVQTGKSYFRRKGNDLAAKLDVKAPHPKQLLYKDGVVSFYEPTPNRITERDVGKNKADVDAAMSLGFGGRGDDLLKAYDVQFAGWEVLDDVRAAKLELVSKNPHGAFSKALIWIDPERDIALQQQFFSTSGDYRLIRYHKIKYNGGVSDNDFILHTHGKPEIVTQ
jgi:outer membrane lipoprotein-sorting protein